MRQMGDRLSDAWEKKWHASGIEGKWEDIMREQKADEVHAVSTSCVLLLLRRPLPSARRSHLQPCTGFWMAARQAMPSSSQVQAQNSGADTYFATHFQLGAAIVPHRCKEMGAELRELNQLAAPAPGAEPSGPRDMTFEDKRRLSQALGSLPGEVRTQCRIAAVASLQMIQFAPA